MNESLIELSVGGMFALMILREVFGFVRRKRDSTIDDSLPTLAVEMREIRGDTTRIRESNHQIVQALQNLTNQIAIWNQQTPRR